ncbi:hypothetical protein FGB62_236g010 [Gracilaria domingensis]|nr:hypothetical protein FGB62_236g010 [Gracilaria domingensis]
MSEEASGNDQRQDKAIITMDSVRIALLRIDRRESAARTQLSSSGFSWRNTAERQTFSKKTTSKSNERECWICKVNHFAYENSPCKKALESKQKLRKTKKNQRPNRGDDQTEFPLPDDEGPSSKNATLNTSLDILYWSMALNPMKDSSTKKELCSIIVDGGAKGTVVGKSNYNQLCKALAHAFGTPENKSQSQEIIARCLLPLLIGNGEVLSVEALVVDGDVRFMLGKDNLQKFKAIESHARERLSLMKNGKRVSMPTPVSPKDGHGRILLSRTTFSMNVAESLLSRSRAPKSDKEAVRPIRRVQGRTPLPSNSMNLLFERAGKWQPWMKKNVNELIRNCEVCNRSGLQYSCVF